MELNQLIQRARGLVDDRIAPLSASDADFVEFANRARREAAERSLCLRGKYEVNMTATEGEIYIPVVDTVPESIVVQRVYIDGKPLGKTSAEEAEAWQMDNTSQDTPKAFAQRDQNLFLLPIPEATGTITLSGVWYPLNTLSLDEPDTDLEIPLHLRDDLAHWMAYEAILAGDASERREERRTRLAERHLAMFAARFGPSRSGREINQWREVPQERRVRSPVKVG